MYGTVINFAARILLALMIVAVSTSAYALGWTSPTSSTDEEGGRWTNPQYAYDNPIQPNLYYAEDRGRVGWGGWLDLWLPAPVRCGRVRVNCDYDNKHVTAVQVDVYNTDPPIGWETIHNGGVNDGIYTQLTFPYRNITGMRFRFFYKDNGWNFWLYEAGLYASPTVPTAPTVATLNPTSVDFDTANIHGMVIDDGGEPCNAWLEYGPDTNYGTTTPVQPGFLIEETFGAFLSGLSGTYHFRAIAQNNQGTSYGEDLQFTVNSVPVWGWVSPTSSYTDPTPPTPNSGGWINQTNAYDDEGITGASIYHDTSDASPTAYIYLTHPAINVDKIRFMAKKTPEISAVDIWVLRGGTWVNVYPSATFNDSAGGTVWNEVSFAAGSVTAARVRFAIPGNYGLNAMLYEFDFHTVGVERCWAFVDGAFGGMSTGYP